MAAWVAFTIVGRSRPLMMISCTLVTPAGRRDLSPSLSRSVGQYSAYVLAIVNEYLLPALDPLAATPPGNGRLTPGTREAARAARSAASRAASAVAPKNQRFPPMS